MSVLEVLTAAKTVLEECGWQRGLPGPTGPVCAAVALARVNGPQPEQEAAYHRLLEEVRRTGWSRTTSLVTWNDEDERSQDQVFKVFDGAIARERARIEA